VTPAGRPRNNSQCSSGSKLEFACDCGDANILLPETSLASTVKENPSGKFVSIRLHQLQRQSYHMIIALCVRFRKRIVCAQLN
jgi:hypothetical protein